MLRFNALEVATGGPLQRSNVAIISELNYEFALTHILPIN